MVSVLEAYGWKDFVFKAKSDFYILEGSAVSSSEINMDVVLTGTPY
jgi:hypothetical protein